MVNVLHKTCNSVPIRRFGNNFLLLFEEAVAKAEFILFCFSCFVYAELARVKSNENFSDLPLTSDLNICAGGHG